VDFSSLEQPLGRRGSAKPSRPNKSDRRFEEDSLIVEVVGDLFLAGADLQTAVTSAFELVEASRHSTMLQSDSLEVIVKLAAKFLEPGGSVHDAIFVVAQLKHAVGLGRIDRAARDIPVKDKCRFETLFEINWREYAPYEKALGEIMRQPHQRRQNLKLRVLEGRFAKQMATLYPELNIKSQLWFWREQKGISCFEFTYFRNLIEKRILETRRKGGQTQISRLSARQNKKIS
jgi:hypothetical protein